MRRGDAEVLGGVTELCNCWLNRDKRRFVYNDGTCVLCGRRYVSRISWGLDEEGGDYVSPRAGRPPAATGQSVSAGVASSSSSPWAELIVKVLTRG